MPQSEFSENTPANSPSSSASSRVLHAVTLALLAAAAVIVRLTSLAAKPFWSDECFSVEIAWIDWRNFFHLMWWREANMSLYYLLLKAWLHLGHSPFFIRSLSVVVGVATIPAIYWLASILYDRRVALVATALLTFNAYDVRYSQEARSYTLLVLLATLSSGFLVAWLRNSERLCRIGYIAASVLAVYAHFYALLLVAAHVVAFRSCGAPEQKASGKLPELNRAWIAIGIAVLPLLVFVAKTGAGPIKWIHRPGLRDLYEFWQHLAGGNTWPLAATFAVACVAAAVPDIVPGRNTSLGRNLDWPTWRFRFLLVWLLFPVVLTVVLSYARPVFLSRYMIFCLPALLILVSAGLARLRSWMLGAVLAVILFLSWQGDVFVYAHDFDTERDAAGAATDFILDHSLPGDAIILYIPATRLPYEFFRSQRAGENTASPDFSAALGPEILFPRHARGLDYRDFTGKTTAEFLSTEPPAHPRVWLMLMNNQPAGTPDPTTLMMSQMLAQSFSRVESWQFPKVEVRLYSRK